MEQILAIILGITAAIFCCGAMCSILASSIEDELENPQSLDFDWLKFFRR